MATFGTNYWGDVVGRYGAEGVAHGYLLLRGRFITAGPCKSPSRPTATNSKLSAIRCGWSALVDIRLACAARA